MSDSGASSNDCAQKQALAFGQRVKQTVPNDHFNSSISYDEVTFHNPLCDSRFKKVPVTVIYSQEPHLGKPPDLPVKARLQSPQVSNQSEIKIVQLWSTAVERDSNSIDNSHQHSNLLDPASQIMLADNSSNNDVSQTTVQTQESPVHSETVAIIATNCEGRAHINKYVSNSSEKTTDNKATRLKRQRERQRERYQTDPAYAERQRERQRERRKDPACVKRQREDQRERQRERRKDPAYVERERKRKKERRRELCKDTAYAKRQREHQRERYQTDPAYAERQRERQKERQRERRKDPVYAERERKRQRERYQTDSAYAERQRERQRERRRKSKKQCCQSVNSANTQVISC